MNATDKAWAVFKARQSMDETLGHLTNLAGEGHDEFKPLHKKAIALYKLLKKEEEDE